MVLSPVSTSDGDKRARPRRFPMDEITRFCTKSQIHFNAGGPIFPVPSAGAIQAFALELSEKQAK